MERLESLLGEAIAGTGHLVTVSGEPGIGKTRVAEELCGVARARGVDVCWGSCYEGEGAPLYWPWSLVMRSFIEARGAAGLRKALGSNASVVAEVIPAVAEAVPTTGATRAPESPAMARFRVFDAMDGFLRRASTGRPMVVVIDDLHWADEPTLGLLSFLCRDVTASRVLLLATYRDLEVRRRRMLEETLGDLARERGHVHLALRRLGPEEVKRYLEIAGGDGVVESAARIHEQTEGNPFLLAEVVKLLEEDPEALGRTSRGVPLPESVREVLGRRLDRLSAPCVELLTGAAGLGREWEARVAVEVRGDGEGGDLLALLDEALATGLIEEMPGSAGRYRFAHALTQQTLLARLSAGKRARLHAAIAQTLERRYGERVEAHARELVEHLERAQEVLGTDSLIRYLLVAGEQALASHAWEEARELFRRALDLGGEGPEDVRTADLLFGLGRAQSALADFASAASCRRAFGIYEKAGLVERAVAVATAAVYAPVEQWADVVGMCDRALEWVEKDSVEEAALLSQYALYCLRPSAQEKPERTLAKALAIARREGATRLEFEVLRRLWFLSMTNLDYRDAAAYAQEEQALAARSDDLAAQCVAAHAIVATDRARGVPLARHAEDAEVLRDKAERLRNRAWLVTAYFVCGRVACQAADWTQAARLGDLCLALLPTGHDDAIAVNRAAEYHYQRCEFEAGDAALATAVSIAGRLPASAYERSSVPMYITMLALQSGRSKWLGEAERYAQQALADGRTVPEALLWARTALARLAVIRGDRAAAERLLEPLESSLPSYFALLTDATVGLVALTAGRTDHAVRLLRTALEQCRRAEDEGSRIWAQYFLAKTLVERSEPGDLEEAGRLLEELLEVTARTGSILCERRARALLERIATLGRTLGRLERADGLTAREIEVLRAIAAGKTNKEIAFDLCIGATTVATHVQNILAKTGAANRAEAVSHAAKNGLVAG